MTPFLDRLAESFPPKRWEGMTILAACSGGADSVALVRGLVELRSRTTTIVVGHFNHRLRGSESDQDQAFVENLAAQYGLPFDTNTLVDGSNQPESVEGPTKPERDESSLRKSRYDFLHNACHRHGARYLLTAHTSNDQAETVLFRLFRGSGLTGLAGITPFRELYLGSDLVLARPMLGVSRAQVLEFLAERQQDYRQDSSNESLQYTRNWIRHQLVPVIQSRMGEDAIPAVIRASESIREIVEWIDRLSITWISSSVEFSRGEVRIARVTAEQTEWPLFHASLKKIWLHQNWPLGDMTQQQWNKIRQFIHSSTPVGEVLKTQLPGSIQIFTDSTYYRMRKW